MSSGKALSSEPVPHIEWCEWADLPWFSRTGSGSELQLCIRLIESAARSDTAAAYLRQEFPEIASEFAVQWVGIMAHGSTWSVLEQFGRQPLESLPQPFLTSVIDRNAGGFLGTDGASAARSWSLVAVPLHKSDRPRELLVLCGRALSGRTLPAAMGVARALGTALDIVRRYDISRQRIDRLRTTLEIASQLGSMRETSPLLELIATEATRLLDADRSSIFIWDREQHEVVGCPALGVEGNLLRIPDNVGVVGECIQTGHVIRVEDAYLDPRFNKQVDKGSGYRTRNLLCVPLSNADGQRIGAFEVMNKRVGQFTAEDEESLIEFGIQAAIALQNTQEREHLVRQHDQLTRQVTEGVQIIGESPAIVALRATIDRLATTDLPVLVLGESGTGKEVIAQSLHYRGPRRNHPFVAVNCAALTETLLESELFGHEKGAFTDAHEARQGKFELAEGGTLFLDEIGDMSQSGQAKLLRVLEQKVVTRVGGSQPIRTNARVVAATNADLAAAVREKRFREDLYYRISVVALDLPPLRERPEDILPLAEFFLEKFSIQAGHRKLTLSPEARSRLQGHSWQGNIRELRNLMERVAFLCPRDRIEADDLAFIISPERGSVARGASNLGLAEATAEFQREYIRRLIKRVKSNMSEAARMLGLHRSNLYRKMRQLEMSEADNGDED